MFSIRNKIKDSVVEQKNITLLDMTQGMSKSKKMLKEFWVKDIDCVVYLSNNSSNWSVQNKTPHQAWNGRKLCISHIRVFGSIT